MLSQVFSITNGTRHCCPLSPSIFNLLIEPLAEVVRSSVEITGFRTKTQPHAINLFADDIVIFLTEPESSLAATHALLQHFSLVSYYKVNFTKSLILPLGVPLALSIKLQNTYPYSWKQTSIPYLGIQLTPKVSQLAEANFPPLIAKITQECHQFSKTKLTCTGRLASFKMLILPQILYILERRQYLSHANTSTLSMPHLRV